MFPNKFKRFRQDRREKLLKALGIASQLQVKSYHREEMYYLAFLNLMSQLEIEKSFHPFRGAANSTLLYAIAKSVSQLPIVKVCELGVGQSTLLLDALATKNEDLSIVSFENSLEWSDNIGSKLENPARVKILQKEMKQLSFRGQSYLGHDIGETLTGKKIDLLVVDGPKGTKRCSRWGSLQIIDENLNDEFLIIFDDVERKGEQETCVEAMRILAEKGITYRTSFMRGEKTQLIIATSAMNDACFY